MSYQNIDIKNISNGNEDIYIVSARIFKQGKLFGYRVQQIRRNSSGQPATYDVSREKFNELVKSGKVHHVKMTASGPSGCDGFALKEVKSITLDILYKVIAGLRIWRSNVIAYVIQYNGEHTSFINGYVVPPHGYFIERADNLNWMLPLSNMEDIRIINKVNDLTICYPVISSENLKDFIGTIDIEVEELDHSHAYIREPYVYSSIIRRAMEMIHVPSSYISDTIYPTARFLSDTEEKTYQFYLQHILAMDVKSHGNFGTNLEEAKEIAQLSDNYLNKFRVNPCESLTMAKSIESRKCDNADDMQKHKVNTRDKLKKPRKKGIAGIFDIFRHRNTK